MPPDQADHAAAAVAPDLSAFAGLAAAMAADEGLAIFRRFNELNLLNILILQDQIHKSIQELNRLYTAGGVIRAGTDNAHPAANAPGQEGNREHAVEGREATWKTLKERLASYSEFY